MPQRKSTRAGSKKSHKPGSKNKTQNAKKSKKKKSKVHITRKTVILVIALLLILLLAIRIVSCSHKSYTIRQATGDGISYTIRGVDVSSYQGDIDWKTIADQNMTFAFIKATEGTSLADENFSKNWEGAQEAGIRVGAYHFMSLSTSGEEQAEHFISVVESTKDMLPPVVDFEMYGDYATYNPTSKEVNAILKPLLSKLEEAYDMTPIIYTNGHLYEKYISGNYDNPIWIADPDLASSLPDGKSWLFCQYSYTGTLEGYSGGVEHIDLNVFNGDEDAFEDL